MLDEIPMKELVRRYERAFGPFTHMSVQEKVIWTRYLQAGASQYAPFVYDLRVGDGLAMPPDSSKYAIKAAAALTTKRIDVVFVQDDVTVIVEVKVRAGLAVIGQLIGYRDLYAQTTGFTGPIVMLLVTDSLQPDVAPILDQQGIIWRIV